VRRARNPMRWELTTCRAQAGEVCVLLYDAIIKLRPEWHDPDPEKGTHRPTAALRLCLLDSTTCSAPPRSRIIHWRISESRFVLGLCSTVGREGKRAP